MVCGFQGQVCWDNGRHSISLLGQQLQTSDVLLFLFNLYFDHLSIQFVFTAPRIFQIRAMAT